MKVLALPKYAREAASTRQRLLQFLPSLAAAGFHVDVRPLLDDNYVRALAGAPSPRRMTIARAYADRLYRVATASEFDLLWVYAELFPKLPGAFERLALRGRTPFIYDFDDAFFESSRGNRLLRGKHEALIAAAAHVTAGNAYLADYARQLNARVTVIPTVVDTDGYRPSPSRSEVPVIGWIGSPSTWHYVRPILPLLQELCAAKLARVLAVGGGEAADHDRFDGLELREWGEATEIADVQAMDIGIMPLPDEPWARGKSGYKLVQYMACGLPTVASPVGVNSQIVDHGRTGYLASSNGEWRHALHSLLDNPVDRERFGTAGRERAVRDYSLSAWAPRLASIFGEVSRR